MQAIFLRDTSLPGAVGGADGGVYGVGDTATHEANLRVFMGNIITWSLITTSFGHDYGPGHLLQRLYGKYYCLVTNNKIVRS